MKKHKNKNKNSNENINNNNNKKKEKEKEEERRQRAHRVHSGFDDMLGLILGEEVVDEEDSRSETARSAHAHQQCLAAKAAHNMLGRTGRTDRRGLSRTGQARTGGRTRARADTSG